MGRSIKGFKPDFYFAADNPPPYEHGVKPGHPIVILPLLQQKPERPP